MLDITRLVCQILRILFKVYFEKKNIIENIKIIFPSFLYKKLAPLLSLNDYIGIYNNQEDLKKSLSKTNISQIIGDNDVMKDHVTAQIEKNKNLANDFKNNKREFWAQREVFLCNSLTLFPSEEINVLDIGGD